jgi:hypothetical protein
MSVPLSPHKVIFRALPLQRFRKPLLGRVLRKSIEDRLDGFKGI